MALRARCTCPAAKPNTSGGHYEDVYVKTAAGWKFKIADVSVAERGSRGTVVPC